MSQISEIWKYKLSI